MTYHLNIDIAAEMDMLEASEWYTRISTSLGERFLACQDEALSKLLVQPLSYQKLHGEIRHLKVEHFPYNFFFYINNSSIHVIALLHEKRDPIIWQKRI